MSRLDFRTLESSDDEYKYKLGRLFGERSSYDSENWLRQTGTLRSFRDGGRGRAGAYLTTYLGRHELVNYLSELLGKVT